MTQAKKYCSGVLSVVLAFGMVLGCAQTAAVADDLDKLKSSQAKVKKAIVSAKKNVSASTSSVKTAEKAVESAAAKLTESQKKLKSAQGKLASLQQRLVDAQIEKEDADARHQQAVEDLQAVQQEVEKTKGDISAQEQLIASAARAVYQSHSDLEQLTFVFGSENASDLANRLQWNDTIFDTTGAQYTKLQDLKTALENLEKEREKSEKAVAKEAKAATELLNTISTLTEEAQTQAAEVETLVGENEKLKKAADAELTASQAELEADKKANEKLEAQEKAIGQQIKEEEARIAAEEARKAAEEKKKAEEAAAKGESVPSESASASPTGAGNKYGFIRPVDANPGSPYGMRYHPILHYWRMHWGQDWGARCGKPLYAMADGTVTTVLSVSQSNGLGNWIVINYGKHGGANIRAGYAHQSKLVVKVGQKVKQGQIVGYVGNTGLSTECHLHLQIYKNGDLVNPINWVW
ncbi:MAG: peptidoglycan DD-metalloendopeptidase family protein [Propionibacteriaceae bacterium]|jgi:murein DD-endopeptidase MepM/ murein hydrolase activator NlpD|nr:peptidoglycan DD-metalloendopeptidase family protein [Propionibacteriaceae bacterium]